jgi:hypothetical protein
VVSKQAPIPPPPAVNEPLPSGMYWAQWCEDMRSAQRRLKTSLPGTERCEAPGQ